MKILITTILVSLFQVAAHAEAAEPPSIEFSSRICLVAEDGVVYNLGITLNISTSTGKTSAYANSVGWSSHAEITEVKSNPDKNSVRITVKYKDPDDGRISVGYLDYYDKGDSVVIEETSEGSSSTTVYTSDCSNATPKPNED